MGKSFSAPLPRPTSECPYFVMVIRPPKALVLIFATEDIQRLICDHIRRSWTAGMKNGDQDPVMADGSCEFLLKGKPFSNTIDSSRKCELILLFCNLLIDLKAAGWRLITGTKDLSQPIPNSSCSTLFFRRMQKNEGSDLAESAGNNEVICISGGGLGDPANILKVINAHTKLVSDLACLIEPAGTCQLMTSAHRGFGGCVSTLKMDQGLWADCESVYSRRFLIKAFHYLNSLGYQFYTALSLDGTSDAVFFERSRPPQPCTSVSIHDTEAILEEDEDEIERENDQVRSEPETTEDDPDVEDRPRAFSASRRSTHSSSGSTSSTDSMSTVGSHFFVMDIYKTNNRLRLIRVPLRLLFIIRSMITLRWPFGLRSVSRLDVDAYEFVLGIDSKNDQRPSTGGNSNNFMCGLFQTLRNQGWHVLASIDLCHQSDKWTFIFHDSTWDSEPKWRTWNPPERALSHSNSSPPSGLVWCMSLSGPSTLTMINAHPELRQGLCELASRYWTRGVKNVVEFGGNRRVRFVGQPWVPSVHSECTEQTTGEEFRENEDLLARGLICILLSELMENYGNQPLCVASIGWKSGVNDRNQASDSHCSWFFLDPNSEEVGDVASLDSGQALPGNPEDQDNKWRQRRSTIC